MIMIADTTNAPDPRRLLEIDDRMRNGYHEQPSSWARSIQELLDHAPDPSMVSVQEGFTLIDRMSDFFAIKKLKKKEKESRRQFLKEFVHWWRETHEPHHMTDDELWEKARTREPITREDLGLPPGSQDGLKSHSYW